MPIWAFACKNESSLNRWFDGTDDDVLFSEDTAYSLEKNSSDAFSTMEEYRKTFLKNISQVNFGIGSAMFNTVQFNAFFSVLSDFDDAIIMQDDIEISFSRAVIRVNEVIYPVEYFNKTFSSSRLDYITPGDDSFAMISDGTTDDGQAMDNAMVSDVSSVGVVKTIQPDIGDSVSFTEVFDANIGGKSIYDLIDMKENVSKDVHNVVGEEFYPGAIGTMVFNELMFNGAGSTADILTTIGLTEEVQIILTSA